MALMISIITFLLRINDRGVEPCSPPTNNTKLTTYITTETNKRLENHGAERCFPLEKRTPPTVWSCAPRPWHHSDFTTRNTKPDPTLGPHQQLGLHPVLNTKPSLPQPRKRHATLLQEHRKC